MPSIILMLHQWDYERTGCANTSPFIRISTTGAIVVANNGDNADFALLLLNPINNPVVAPNIEPYFLGWSRSSNAPSKGVGIHHPKGDVKKISLSSNIRSRLIFWTNRWRVEWYEGTTEGGSSGSPLLNNNGQIIGQLWNGMAACWNDFQGFDGDNYGRFNISWTGDGSSNIRRRLKDWLDPNNTNVSSLNGINGCFTDYVNQTISTNRTITGCNNLNVQNVTITSGTSVVITAGEEIITNVLWKYLQEQDIANLMGMIMIFKANVCKVFFNMILEKESIKNTKK